MTMQGSELRELRKQMNLRQAGLADALGLTPQYVGLMERGKAPIEARTEMAVRYMVEHPFERPDVEIDDIPTYNAADMMEKVLEDRGLFDGKEWGPWRFSADSMTLDFYSRLVNVGTEANPEYERQETYYVSLAECTQSKWVIDWLGQIASKGWGPAALGYLTQAFDDIFHFQGRYVHGDGFESREAVVAYLRSRLGEGGESA